MRRSDFLMKLMSVVLLVAITAYIGLYIYNTANNPLKTAFAGRYIVEDRGYAKGYIIRTESVLTSGNGVVSLLPDEGEKVASGQAVAVVYEGDSALARASEIRLLQIEIRQAESSAALATGQNSAAADESLLLLSSAVNHRDLSRLEDISLSVRESIFTSSGDSIDDAGLSVMKSRLAALLSQREDTETFYAPMGGVFSAAVDGFEAVGPDSLGEVTPSALDSLFSVPRVTGAPLGKLITGIKWYYAAMLDAEDARKLDGKDTAVVKFTKTYNARLTMKVESIGPEENGKCVVVFSAKRNISEMTALRQLTAQIEFNAYTGLTIPKDAVFVDDDGQPYTYLLTGFQAERVDVEIISELGDTYVVADGAQNGSVIREGSEIIVEAEDLYDGKVVA